MKLPTEGRNFEPYSLVGASLGRTYVHSTVLATVVDAYGVLETALPGVTFVYGETGWRNGIGIKQVIFDTQYLPKLFATTRGAWLERNVSFMRREPWIRHDEHYHVDFAVRCS